VKVYEGTAKNMTERSTVCIALYPAANSTGWVLWKIATRSKVRGSNVVKLVTTDAIISTMNAIVEEDAVQARAPAQRRLEEIVSQQPTEVRNVEAEEQEAKPEENQEESKEVEVDEEEN
jgi:hypothetical protein